MTDEWTVRIDDFPISLAVGVYEHEYQPQPLLVSLEIVGNCAALPFSLSECLDYEPLCYWLKEEWPKSPHVPLLEMRLNQLFEHIFASDKRVIEIQAGLYKKNIAEGARRIGMERRISRLAFENLSHVNFARELCVA